MDIDFSFEDNQFRAQVRDWLEDNVPREPRPVGDRETRAYDIAWQRRQYDAGWAGISWPAEYGGRGLSLIQQIIWFEEYARAGGPYIGCNFVGINHGGPTLIACGSDEHKRYHLPLILKGEKIWCQGFSEPGAGSDLAGIRTQARIEGDHLVVNGQKIWTSYAQHADYQELLLRTDPSAQRHKGMTWVICDMHTPGITVRPIRTIAGNSDLNEVFYDEVRVPMSNIVGGLNKGWQTAMSTLAFERGTGFIVDQVKLADKVETLIELAQSRTDHNGRSLLANDRIAAELADLRALVAALRSMTYVNVSRVARTGIPGAEASIVRLYTAELGQRVDRMEMELLGDDMLDFHYGNSGPVYDYLLHFASTIAGGSAQVQRDIIGERVLGLPRGR